MCLRVLEILYCQGHLSHCPCVEWGEGRYHGHVLALVFGLCSIQSWGFTKSDFRHGLSSQSLRNFLLHWWDVASTPIDSTPWVTWNADSSPTLSSWEGCYGTVVITCSRELKLLSGDGHILLSQVAVGTLGSSSPLPYLWPSKLSTWPSSGSPMVWVSGIRLTLPPRTSLPSC